MKVSSDVLYSHVYDDLKDATAAFDKTPECSFRRFAAVALLESVLKKYQDIPHKDLVAADVKAIEKFLSVNESLPNRLEPSQLYDDYLIGELRQELDKFWYHRFDDPLVSSLHQIFLSGRVGPGKSLGSDWNDCYSKLFQSTLTSTSRHLYTSYRASTDRYPLWKASEVARANSQGEVSVVKRSKLLLVPKSVDISRCICVEPNLNMFYQLGFGRILEKRLRQVYGLDLSVQPDLNRELARQGSINGEYITIDLSSASDSMSYRLLENILPRGFFSWLNILRTPETQLPDGRVIALNMISTMGNGFTFPLQTILFAAMVSVAYKLSGIPLLRPHKGSTGNFAVFGDDIIVRRETFEKVSRLLDLFGFKMNVSKTFVEGPFRESCGSDFFNGRFVRGVYIKTLRSPQDRYVAINLFNDWTASTGIILPRTVQYLLSSVKRVLIPPFSPYDGGIHCPLSFVPTVRYDLNGSIKFRSFQSKPTLHRILDDGSINKRQGSLVNLDGLLVTFIAGYIRSQAISVRQFRPSYVMRGGKTPFWDFFPLSRSYSRFSYKRWETAVYWNSYK